MVFKAWRQHTKVARKYKVTINILFTTETENSKKDWKVLCDNNILEVRCQTNLAGLME